MTVGSENAVERVWASVRADPRHALERGLPPSDMNTLLMALSRARAADVTPARLMQRWRDDRFVRPSACDPREIWRVETKLWDLLPEQFDGIDLSPVAPLAASSGVALVAQNRVISTTRGSEVVSDATNVLALEAASRRKRNPSQPVNLAACHRVLRGQVFDGEGLFQHFRLFALLSSARDRGSGSTEAEMLHSHLHYCIEAVSQTAPGRGMTVEFSSFDSAVLSERFNDTVFGALQPLPRHVLVQQEPSRQRARGYYRAGAIRIDLDGTEIGDGGFTDWTAKLMADDKERCFISCLSTERLTAVAGGGA